MGLCEPQDREPLHDRFELIRRICQRAEVRRYTYYTIRHFVASYLYDKEKRPLPQISKLLRHTHYQTTERYLQLVDPNLRETMRLLERSIGRILKEARADGK